MTFIFVLLKKTFVFIFLTQLFLDVGVGLDADTTIIPRLGGDFGVMHRLKQYVLH